MKCSPAVHHICNIYTNSFKEITKSELNESRTSVYFWRVTAAVSVSHNTRDSSTA